MTVIGQLTIAVLSFVTCIIFVLSGEYVSGIIFLVIGLKSFDHCYVQMTEKDNERVS